MRDLFQEKNIWTLREEGGDLKSKAIQNLIKQIAEDNNITVKETKHLITTQFKFVAQVMKNSGSKDNNYSFKSVYIPFFGSFRVAKRRTIRAREGNLKNKTNEE